jgi:hypothetical protein
MRLHLVGMGDHDAVAESGELAFEPVPVQGGFEGARGDVALVEIESDGDHESSREWNREGVPRVAVQRRVRLS